MKNAECRMRTRRARRREGADAEKLKLVKLKAAMGNEHFGLVTVNGLGQGSGMGQPLQCFRIPGTKIVPNKLARWL